MTTVSNSHYKSPVVFNGLLFNCFKNVKGAQCFLFVYSSLVKLISSGFFLYHSQFTVNYSSHGTPLQYSCLENPMDGGALVGCSPWGHSTSLSLLTFMHWRRKWQPTPVFLPGESRGRGSLVGCRLWGCTESDTTEAT